MTRQETIKLFENEYKQESKIISKVIRENSTYNIICGGRNGHKSTEIQVYFFLQWLKNQNQFLLIRRKTSNTVNNWFSSHFCEVLEKTGYTITFKKKLFDGDKYTGYYMVKDPNNNKSYILGKVVYLSVEQTYRSNELSSMNNIKYALYEEFIAKNKKEYLIDEPQLLADTCSTFARSKSLTIFLIGNTNKGQRNNPHFHFFGVDDFNFKMGDLLTFNPFNKFAQTTLYLPFNLEDSTEYQNINNNDVGLGKEWEQDDKFLDISLLDLKDSQYKFENIVVEYRKRIYYLYLIKSKKAKRDYYYLTQEYLQDVFKYPPTFKEFKKSLPLKQREYSIEVLRFLYPKFFDIINNEIKFINRNGNKKFQIIKLYDESTQFDKIEIDYYNQLNILIDILSVNYYFVNDNALLYFIKQQIERHVEVI